MDGENVLFEAGNVRITSERLSIGNQSFSLRSISTVDLVELRPGFWGVFWGVLIGGGCLACGEINSLPFLSIIGAVIAGLSILAFQRLKPSFSVILRTPKGEVRAYETTEKPKAAEIVVVLNQVMREK
jgi:hypothetical protein